MKQVANILIQFFILFGLVSCGTPDYLPDQANSGVALKEDGTPFGVNAKIIGISNHGVAAIGTIDSKGNYKVEFPQNLGRSGKKSKTYSSTIGNYFIKISEGENTQYLVLPSYQSKLNINAVTIAASQLLYNSFDVNLATTFDAVELELTANNKEYVLIENEETLSALSKIPELWEHDISDAAKLVVGAMFGFDSSGEFAVKVDNFLTGPINSKENYLLKAAASITNNLIAAIVSACNNPENSSYLLNNPSFYEALGKEIASGEENLTTTEFTELFVKTIQSLEVQMNLSEIAAELDAYVLAVKEDSSTPFVVEIPAISVSPSIATINLLRDVDELTLSVDGCILNDETKVTIIIQSSSARLALVEMPLIFDGTNFSINSERLYVLIDEFLLSVTIINTTSLSNNTINLSTLLSEINLVLEASNYDNVPSTTAEYDILVFSRPISRNENLIVPTFIATTSETVSSIVGVSLE